MMEMSQWLASQQSQMQAQNNRLAVLRQKVQVGDDALANLIGNQSDMSD